MKRISLHLISLFIFSFSAMAQSQYIQQAKGPTNTNYDTSSNSAPTTQKEAEIKEVSTLSCNDIVEIIKESECANLVRSILKGAHITSGLAWQSLVVLVKDKETNKLRR